MSTRRMRKIGRPAPAALAGGAVLLAIAAWWTWRALHDARTFDVGLAYDAGRVVWSTGHPEVLPSWTGVPFLGGTMALLARVVSAHAVAVAVTVLNLAILLVGLTVVLRALRGVLSEVWWWVAALGVVTFAPLVSSVWWKQFNLIALALALGGFELARRGSRSRAAALIGVSVALKPMVVLLPFALLLGRRTRLVGLQALGWIVGLTLAAQALMAIRAHDLARLGPLVGIDNVINKAKASAVLCGTYDYSPASLLCRNVGLAHWSAQRAAAWVLVGLFALWAAEALRGRGMLSWEAFAWVCALSAMLSPFEWTHYQVMLLPLFLLLLVRFTREGADVGEWAGFAVAYVLASLVWQPYGSIAHALGHPTSIVVAPDPTFSEGISQFAQYVLLFTATLWYARHPPVRAEEAALAPSLSSMPVHAHGLERVDV